MILNPHPHEDYAKRQSTKPAWLTPRTDFPRKDELTINIGDIEHFENSHPTSPHKESTYLNTIGAIIKLADSDDFFNSTSELKELILRDFPGVGGISQRNLDSIFAKAIRSIDSTK